MRDLIVIHTADLHLGRNRKYDDYLAQQSFMLAGILAQVEKACRDNPSADVYLVLSGDVFDRNQDTRRSEFVLFLTSFLQPLIAMRKAFQNLQVFVIDGNHDREPNPDEPSVLMPLRDLFTEHFHFAVVQPKVSEQHSMLMLPYGGYSAKEMRSYIENSRAQLVMAHECLNRMQTDTGWTPPRNQEKYIEIDDVLPETRVAGVFLGDIHRCQPMDKGRLCWYSGSPVTLDHGHKMPKGILHHFYSRTADGLVKAKEPELVPIDDPRIKMHFQLGKVFEVDVIPWDRLYQHFDCYLDIVVTPETYAAISKQIPGFFHSKQVSYSFKENAADAAVKEEGAEEAQEDAAEYYRRLIRMWTDDNLDDLPAALRDDFLERTGKVFDERG